MSSEYERVLYLTIFKKPIFDSNCIYRYAHGQMVYICTLTKQLRDTGKPLSRLWNRAQDRQLWARDATALKGSAGERGAIYICRTN